MDNSLWLSFQGTELLDENEVLLCGGAIVCLTAVGSWPPILILFSLLALQFVVGLGDKVSPTDIEEGMRVGYLSLSLSVMTTVGS
jgi:hypothetical protein